MTRSNSKPLEIPDQEIERTFHIRRNLAKLKSEMAENADRLREAETEIARLRAQIAENAAVRHEAQVNQ